jgi:CBS domain-containing protein
MTTGILVKDAMVPEVITVGPVQTVLEASRIMFNHNVGSLVVIEGDVATGIVTREDVINKVVSKDVQPSKITVKDIMNSSLVSCSPEDDISYAAKLMSKNRYERIPVISMGKLVGIISTREIAKVAPAALEAMTEHLRIEEPQNFREEPASEGGECEKCGNFADELHNINDNWVCDSCLDEGTL